MNIQTVAENLRNTIAGKEAYLSEWNNANITETADRIHRATIVGMLKVNIDELKRILQDVEQCIPQTEYSLDGPMIKMFRED
jgi:hypothetical protein